MGRKKIGSIFLTYVERTDVKDKFRIGLEVNVTKEVLARFIEQGSLGKNEQVLTMRRSSNIKPLKGLYNTTTNRKCKKRVPAPVRVPSARVRAHVKDTGNTYFDKFWKLYPRKSSKKPCLALWEKLEKDEELPHPRKVIRALKRQIEFNDWNEKAKDKKERHFIPHPKTWLNQGRWDDEIDEDEVKPKRKVNIGCQTRR